jgi:hypothetical protein
MRTSRASIMRFHFSVVIVPQFADQPAAARCLVLAPVYAAAPRRGA